jgi:cysteinyl-tRNA synthetase
MDSEQIKLLDTLNNKYFTIDLNNKKSINIYICGPTVYTHTHIGHLKTYMTFDIIRRVLEDYFKIPIKHMMNITNVDDKIITGTYQQEYGQNVDLNTLDQSKYLPNNKFDIYASYWEDNFFKVMDLMNIKRPNIVGRVTDYINEIFEFVSEIEKNGYTFESDGSVYFYGTKYGGVKLNESETYSKNPNDPLNFVLIKKIRPYEPGWQSKWGLVRPSWHSECSALASSAFGSNFDIHCGGIDLAFPHHHNEVLQSNARYNHNGTDKNWVDHFMHMGHLNIEGLKMSRSLKNFITVNEILEKYTPNQLRMLFLIHEWAVTMDYSEETMTHAIFYVDFFNNFIIQLNSIMLRPNMNPHKKFSSLEINQLALLNNAKLDVDMALKNNINTPNVIKILHNLASSLFIYVKQCEEIEQSGITSQQILYDTMIYIKNILNMFGIDIDINSEIVGKEQQLIKVIADLRNDIRTVAKNTSNKIKHLDIKLAKELSQNLFKLTDDLRDIVLPNIGIKLTDK